jgi:hypothetical protein
VKRELATNVYRWAPSGKLEVVVTEEQVPDPNGIPFSPDHKKICRHQLGRGIHEASAFARSYEQNRPEIFHTDVKYISDLR